MGIWRFGGVLGKGSGPVCGVLSCSPRVRPPRGQRRTQWVRSDIPGVQAGAWGEAKRRVSAEVGAGHRPPDSLGRAGICGANRHVPPGLPGSSLEEWVQQGGSWYFSLLLAEAGMCTVQVKRKAGAWESDTH